MRNLVIAILVAYTSYFLAGAQTNPLYSSGYQGYVEMSMGMVSGNGVNVGVLTSHGYGTGFGLYTGMGTGFIISPESGSSVSTPVYFDLKYSFIDDDFSPYAAMKTGVSFSIENGSTGILLSPSIGVDIRKHLSMFLGYGYETTSWERLLFKKHVFSVGLSLGF